jgi:hypothetical protein
MPHSPSVKPKWTFEQVEFTAKGNSKQLVNKKRRYTRKNNCSNFFYYIPPEYTTTSRSPTNHLYASLQQEELVPVPTATARSDNICFTSCHHPALPAGIDPSRMSASEQPRNTHYNSVSGNFNHICRYSNSSNSCKASPESQQEIYDRMYCSLFGSENVQRSNDRRNHTVYPMRVAIKISELLN